MNTVFDLKACRHCRQARIVYEAFQTSPSRAASLVAAGRCGSLRVDTDSVLRHSTLARPLVKQAHWLLPCSCATLKTPTRRLWLDAVLAAEQSAL